MGYGTERPNHDALSPVGSGWTFDDPKNYHQESEMLYNGVSEVGSGWDFDDPEYSLWGHLENTDQYIAVDESLNLDDDAELGFSLQRDESLNLDDDPEVSQVLEFDESLNLDDDAETSWGIDADDSMNLDDETVLSGPVVANDSLGLVDESFVEQTFEIDDGFDFADETEVFGDVEIDDSLSLADNTNFELLFSIDEQLNLADEAEVIKSIEIDSDSSIALADEVSIRRTVIFKNSTEVKVSKKVQQSYSTEILVTEFDPPPSQILDSPDNPIQPTVIRNGVVIVENESTRKGDGNQISLNLAAVYGHCSVQSFTLDTSFNNIGSFTIYASEKFVDENEEVTLCGIKCWVKEVGPFAGNSGEGFLIKGVVGPTAEMNKKLILTAQNTTGLKDISSQFPIQQPPTQLWTTVQAAAQAISLRAGFALKWLAGDAVLQDTFIETEMRAEEAIASLASKVGGVYVTDGKDSCVVCNPYPGYGEWQGLGECDPWGTGGLTGPILVVDMDNTAALLPVELASQLTVNKIDNPLTTAPPVKVEPLHVIESKMKPDAPDLLLRVAGDFQMPAKVQILVAAGDTGPAYTTTNPNQWFDAPFPLTTLEDKKKALIVKASDIPTALRNGAFHMSIGYTRDLTGINAFHNESVEVFGQKKSSQYTSIFEKLRYFRWKYANATFPLFGAVPLPGNQATFTFKGNTIVGTIESVNINGKAGLPPEVNVSIGTFARLTMERPLNAITGITIGMGSPY